MAGSRNNFAVDSPDSQQEISQRSHWTYTNTICPDNITARDHFLRFLITRDPKITLPTTALC